MKKEHYLFISLILLSSINFSCQKICDPNRSVNVEYRVTPVDVNIYTLWYTDTTTTYALSSTKTGKQIIPVAFASGTNFDVVNRPFRAFLKTAIKNYDVNPANYDLEILVNGHVKKKVVFSVPGGKNVIDSAVYVIQ